MGYTGLQWGAGFRRALPSEGGTSVWEVKVGVGGASGRRRGGQRAGASAERGGKGTREL